MKMLKIYDRFPVFTTIEGSFSTLKLVKNKLCSLCSDERLTFLLLLAIEKAILKNNSDIIVILFCLLL